MHGSLEMRETLEHRNYVANAAPFSTGAAVFNMMYELGLQPDHTLVDVGCGSLRVGRFLIMYLEPHKYVGIEPNIEILEAGIHEEVSTQLCVDIKQAEFFENSDYGLSYRKFDWVLISGVLVHKSHSEIAKAINAAYRMLNPNGKLVVDYYPSWPHWNEEENPVYPQIAPHERECLLIHPGFAWTGFDKELFGAHYIQLIKNG